MKTVRIVSEVIEDDNVVEAHTMEIPLYETIRSDNIPKEVLANIVANLVTDICQTHPSWRPVYKILLDRLREPEIVIIEDLIRIPVESSVDVRVSSYDITQSNDPYVTDEGNFLDDEVRFEQGG